MNSKIFNIFHQSTYCVKTQMWKFIIENIHFWIGIDICSGCRNGNVELHPRIITVEDFQDMAFVSILSLEMTEGMTLQSNDGTKLLSGLSSICDKSGPQSLKCQQKGDQPNRLHFMLWNKFREVCKKNGLFCKLVVNGLLCFDRPLLSSLDCHTVFESYGAPEKRALQSNASQTHYVNVVRGDRSKVIPIRCCRRKANVIRNGEKCGALWIGQVCGQGSHGVGAYVCVCVCVHVFMRACVCACARKSTLDSQI